MIESCNRIQRPVQEHGPHLQACGGLDWERLEASQIDILRRLDLLHQYGLAPLKSQGSKEEARHGIAWAPTFI